MGTQGTGCRAAGKAELNRVKYYIRKFTEHSLAGTETGAVLDDMLASSGKMIRPRLLLLSSAFGPDREARKERLYMLGAFAEMTHMASLVHDDIVDDARFRRGKPSLQSRYGKDAAVYAGDFLIARMNARLAGEGFPGAAVLLSETVERMCLGEIGQARFRYREDVTAGQYLENIKRKTASLFRAACILGAKEAGCGDRENAIFASLGENLGIMFQLRDDLMDFKSGSEEQGKDTRKDFLEGIYTLPVILAAEQEAGRKAILPYMQKSREGTISPEEVREMAGLVLALGGERTAEEIHRYGRMSVHLLDELEENPAKEEIRALIGKLDAI